MTHCRSDVTSCDALNDRRKGIVTRWPSAASHRPRTLLPTGGENSFDRGQSEQYAQDHHDGRDSRRRDTIHHRSRNLNNQLHPCDGLALSGTHIQSRHGDFL